MNKKLFCILLLLTPFYFSYSQDQTLESFPLSSVQLLESPFLSAQTTDFEYIMEMDPDRLLAPFLVEAGLEPKAPKYGNWENTGLDGHIGGHYLSALAMMYASTGEAVLLERLDYMVDELAACQQQNGNGYVGGVPGGEKVWEEIRNGNIDAGSFSLNGKWVPLYNIHKLYAGLRDAYLIANHEKAKYILIGLTDWMLDLTSGLTDGQVQDMLRSEHGGLNEVFADVAAITGDAQYMRLAERFSQRAILDPLLSEKDMLTGLHANTQIPKVIGFKRIADLEEKKEWNDASRFFWNTIVNDRSVSIGGNSVREHFHPTNDFSSMIASEQGPETCNTYNMLRLSHMLFLTEPKSSYMDYYERALYNHILSSQHPDGGFVYFTPMRPRHYRVYSQPHETFWCCVGSGLENHAKYGEIIYAKSENDLYVNLFIPSILTWKEKGLTLTQRTNFPEEETSEIKVGLEKSSKFTINLRHPSWTDNFEIRVNGAPVAYTSNGSGYIAVERTWRDGDEISVHFPMKLKLERLPDGSPWISILKGPLVMAAVTDSTDLDGLFADGERMAHVAAGDMYPIDEAPTLVAKNDAQILSNLSNDSDGTLTYQGAVHPATYEGFKLVPFYKVHEARYMLYWPVLDEEALDKRMAEIKEKEAVMLALEKRTVDHVAPGEQQPESEHNFKGEQTESGNYQGRFWRHAQGWFSYDLKNKNKEGKILRITYFGGDKDRNFDILLNNKLLNTVKLDGSKENVFYDVDYEIPNEVLNDLPDNQMTLKFVAHEGSVAGGIYYIRLLKEESVID